MDQTLNKPVRGVKRHQERNWNAWQSFAVDGGACPFCGHAASAHLLNSGQPHFYRPATGREARKPPGQLRRYLLADGRLLLVKRIIVARNAEVINVFCRECAAAKGTRQVMCYQRTLAVGELVGAGKNGAD